METLTEHDVMWFFLIMYKQLNLSAYMLTFIHSRVSTESLVRNVCAFALAYNLDAKEYRVRMETHDKRKTTDILVYDLADGKLCEAPACQFLVRMAYPETLEQDSEQIRMDIESMKDIKNAWVLTLYYISKAVELGASYRTAWNVFAEGVGKEGVGKLVKLVNQEVRWKSQGLFNRYSEGYTANACLLAWCASPTYTVTQCTLHSIPLEWEAVEGGPHVYYSNEFCAARREYFPYADTSPLSSAYNEHYCVKCCEAKKAWIQEHSKRRS